MFLKELDRRVRISIRIPLSTLVIVTDTDGTLVGESVGPEATEVNVHLGGAGVGEQQPSTEDWLGEDVEDGVGDDLLIDVHLAAAIGNTPDDWVGGPEDEGEATDGGVEVANLATTSGSGLASVDNKLPDNNEVGNAGNGVPSPLLRGTLRAESSEEAGQDHDDVGNNGDKDAATVHASKESEIQEQEWGGQSPVNVTSPVYLAVDLVGGVWNVLVGLANGGLVVADTVSASHGEVGEGSEDGDHGGDDVEEALGHWDAPCHDGEDEGRHQHHDENDPKGTLASLGGILVFNGWDWDNSRERVVGRRGGESLNWVDHICGVGGTS